MGALLTVLVVYGLPSLSVHGQAPRTPSPYLLELEVRNSIQLHTPVDSLGFDARLFFRLHGWESNVAPVWLGSADRSAYPVFLGTAPLLFALGQQDTAVTTGISVVTAFAGALVLKRISGRTRPYARWSHVQPRSGYPGTRHLSPNASLPSGHAALAAAVATSLTLEGRSPWVAGGSMAWAASVGVSRVWLGVHYPGDVLAGTALGVGVGVAAHLLVNAIQR